MPHKKFDVPELLEEYDDTFISNFPPAILSSRENMVGDEFLFLRPETYVISRRRTRRKEEEEGGACLPSHPLGRTVGPQLKKVKRRISREKNKHIF